MRQSSLSPQTPVSLGGSSSFRALSPPPCRCCEMGQNLLGMPARAAAVTPARSHRHAKATWNRAGRRNQPSPRGSGWSYRCTPGTAAGCAGQSPAARLLTNRSEASKLRGEFLPETCLSLGHEVQLNLPATPRGRPYRLAPDINEHSARDPDCITSHSLTSPKESRGWPGPTRHDYISILSGLPRQVAVLQVAPHV